MIGSGHGIGSGEQIASYPVILSEDSDVRSVRALFTLSDLKFHRIAYP